LKSKLKLRAFLIIFLTIFLTTVLIYILSDNLPIKFEDIRWFDVYMSILFFFTWTWLVFGELRTQIIELTIQNNQVTKKNLLGLKREFKIKEFEGYQTSLISSRSGRFEYLYFIKDDKKIIKISEAYHKNYSELKKTISTELKDLGDIQFSYIDEFKEIFK